ncbi:hypothetical protein KL86PLE_30550 [uncultured Pleomorphomonas sp.]|uniref:Uncharacterized protein n=1 Tax=uncultured Pleomorphomonas sp. TaxID=442121 RepID=A0A212LEW0_9HYPH|nr:hypothetical protein KL86PLE_30550 [uncultured Pleomorphomonas sp.]
MFSLFDLNFENYAAIMPLIIYRRKAKISGFFTFFQRLVGQNTPFAPNLVAEDFRFLFFILKI